MTDMAGIVHFSEFFRWMEMAEHAVFRHLGIPIFSENGGEVTGYPRIEASSQYIRPLIFPGEVVTELEIVSRDSRRLEFAARFYANSIDHLCATGSMKTVYVRRIALDGEMESLPLEENWLEIFDSAINGDETIEV